VGRQGLYEVLIEAFLEAGDGDQETLPRGVEWRGLPSLRDFGPKLDQVPHAEARV